MSLVGQALRLGSSTLVLAFSARRLLFLLASSRDPRPPSTTSGGLASLAIVVACRNEARSVRRLLEALDETDYPGDLSVVLVDDASEDETGDLLASWAAVGKGRFVVELSEPGGKVQALEAGAAAVPGSELVGVCDADQRPHPDAWRRLAVMFSDERVGAVAGFLSPTNHDASVVSKYAAVEAWVHQLVTSEGKDRLDLNPPTLGGGALYRRAALEEVGGFVAGISGEDVTTSVALSEAGWTTRFVRDAVVENDVVVQWGDYWHQHLRWARGSFDTMSEHRRRSRATLPRRLEAWFVSAGYLDRVGFLVSCVLSKGRGRWLPVAYVGVAGLEVCVVLARAGVLRPRRVTYLAALAVVFPADVAATAVAVVSHARRRPHVWRSPR